MDVTQDAVKPATPTLEVRLFGGFDARLDGKALPPLRSRREQWLLALLVLRHDRDTARNWLATTLWPDNEEEKALFYLRKSLSHLRQALGKEASRLLSPTPRTIRFDITGAFADVVVFDRAVASAREEAVTLYRGPLLPDCLEEWASVERNQREQAYRTALESLASDVYGRGEAVNAVHWLRLLIATDPYRESAHISLMKALSNCGDLAAVTVVYQELRARLRQELNTSPAPDTEAVYQRISKQTSLVVSPPPPALTPTPTRRHLPVPLSDLIGRESEIATVRDYLKHSRLVTLLGAGGIGKTRLSIAVAEAVMPQFDDGVWLVDLAPLSDATLVPQAAAKAFAIPEEGNRPVSETLAEALTARSLLLVLDNCEHLIEASAELAYLLLSTCPNLHIIATSRQALNILGEQVYRVPSLLVPPDQSHREVGTSEWQEQDPRSLMAYEAVRLFVDRAERVNSGFRLHSRNAVAVIEICRQLDGIPLAIEMAAARLRSLSVSEINTRLEDRFRLLTSGNRGVLPRQQTIRALIDWSYELLTDAEKLLLRRLSVFAGGWTGDAAVAVAGVGDWWSVVGGRGGEEESIGGISEAKKIALAHSQYGTPSPPPHRPPAKNQEPIPRTTETFDLLASLVDKSIVVYEDKAEGAWYRFLETIRQYAGDRLRESGERDSVRDRHLTYYLTLAEAAETKLIGPQQSAWFARLEQEYENLRLALEWSLNRSTAGDSPTSTIYLSSLRLCGALQRFWWTRDHLSEARGWCAEALSKAEAQARTRERARALNAAGILAYVQGDYVAAREYHQESLFIRRELGDRGGIGSSLNNLGNVASAQEDYIAARNYLEESLTLLTGIGDPGAMVSPIANLGNVAFAQGDYPAALHYLEQGLRIQREIGNWDGVANTLINLGNVTLAQNDYPAARTYLKESLTILKEIGNRSGVRDSLEALATLAVRENGWNQAAVLWAASEVLRVEIGSPLPTHEREPHDRKVEEVRAALGNEVFSSAWATGRSLTMEEAIQYALQPWEA